MITASEKKHTFNVETTLDRNLKLKRKQKATPGMEWHLFLEEVEQEWVKWYILAWLVPFCFSCWFSCIKIFCHQRDRDSFSPSSEHEYSFPFYCSLFFFSSSSLLRHSFSYPVLRRVGGGRAMFSHPFLWFSRLTSRCSHVIILLHELQERKDSEWKERRKERIIHSTYS